MLYKLCCCRSTFFWLQSFVRRCVLPCVAADTFLTSYVADAASMFDPFVTRYVADAACFLVAALLFSLLHVCLLPAMLLAHPLCWPQALFVSIVDTVVHKLCY